MKESNCKGVLPAARETLRGTNAEAKGGLGEFSL